MNSAQRVSRRHALLVLGSVVAVAPPLSTIGAAAASLQPAPANTSIVPAAVVRIIVEQLKIDAVQVKWDARFVEDLGIDSLETVELLMALEEEYKIEIPDEAAEKLLRVGDLVAYLRKREVVK